METFVFCAVGNLGKLRFSALMRNKTLLMEMQNERNENTWSNPEIRL